MVNGLLHAEACVMGFCDMTKTHCISHDDSQTYSEVDIYEH